VSCYAAIQKIGHTSLTVKIESWVRRARGIEDHQSVSVTEGIFTYVAIGPDGAPRPVPPEK
jgi:acyl-CoA thioesterase YciA